MCCKECVHICQEDIFIKEALSYYDVIDLYSQENEKMMNEASFTYDNIIKAINKIPAGSATGPDGVPSKIIKKAAHPIAKILVIIAQNSMEVGIFPSKYKNTFIIGVYKGGDRCSPSQYRPIALTSHLAKTLEQVVRSQMVDFMERNNLFDPLQHGSRAGRSTISQMLEHYDEILEGLENGYNVDVVYIDFSKAYDKVDLGILTHKIRNMGFMGKLGEWLANFYCKRSQAVIVKNEKSNVEAIISGIPQGSVLGPLLFLIYIGNIDEEGRGSRVYVDDVKTMAYVKNENDVQNFQRKLENIYDWGDRNNSIFNNDKFMLLRYGKDENIKYDTSYFTPDMAGIIEEHEDVRDLGLRMSSNADFNAHISEVIKKMRKVIGWVLRSFMNRSIEFMKRMWVAIIRPLIDYGSQVWSPTEGTILDKIEKLQYDYTRLIPEIRNLTYEDRLKKLGISSLQRRFERYKIFYVWKILQEQVPSCRITIRSEKLSRNGLKLNVNRTDNSRIGRLRDQSFQYSAPKI